MTKTSETGERHFYTNPSTGYGIPCTIVRSDEDGAYEVELTNTGERGEVTAGDLYRLDESGRYLGGPA